MFATWNFMTFTRKAMFPNKKVTELKEMSCTVGSIQIDKRSVLT